MEQKSAISLQRSQYDRKFKVERAASHQSFLHGQLGQRMPYIIAANGFHTKKLRSRLYIFKRTAILDRNRPFCDF